MLYLKLIHSKFISIILLLAISVTTSAYGSTNPALFTRKSHAQRYLKKSGNKLPLDFTGKDSSSAINIPRRLGVVVERYNGESGYTVIHIQDSHINPTAQFNIASIIEEIATKYNTSLMCLEGASAELDISFYDKFPDDEAKRRIAGFFVERSLFTGAEFYKILHKAQYLKTIGVEDKKAYLEHLFYHRKNRLSREVVLGSLKELERGLISLKSRVYSKSLKDLSGKSCLYHLKQFKLPEYLNILEKYSKKAKIDISRYENLIKMLALMEKEKELDFQAAATEREALVLYLSELLPAKKLRELSAMSLNFKLNKRSDIEFYTYLEQFLNSQLLQVKDAIRAMRYNHLIAYIDYLKFSKSIDYLMVYDEAERLEEEVSKALCTNSTQQRLVEYTKAVSILLDFYELKLTSGRLDYMDRNQDYFDIQNIIQFLKEACNKYGLPLEDALLVSIDKMFIENTKNFYEIALKRDIAITENTLKSMRCQRKDRAILITGGFHTRGITNILKEKGISYVVICPNIGLMDSERLYLDRLAGRLQDVSELTELFSQTLTAPLVTGDASVAEVSFIAQEAFKMCWNISNNAKKLNTPAHKAEEMVRQINSRSIKIYPYDKKNDAYMLDKGGVLKAIYDSDYPVVVRFMIEGISDYVILGFRVEEDGISALSTHFPDDLQGKRLNSQVFEALGNVIEKGAILRAKISNSMTRKRLFSAFEVVAGSIKKRGAGDNIVVDENLIADAFSKTLMGNLFARAGFSNFKLMLKRNNGSYMRGLEALTNILLASRDGKKTGEFCLEAVKLYSRQPTLPQPQDGEKAEPIKSSSAGKEQAKEDITMERLSEKEREAIADVSDKVLAVYPKFKIHKKELNYFIMLIGPGDFSKAFANNLVAVVNALKTVFRNWDEDKLTALIKHVTQDAFTKAFANNPAAVAHALRIIFADWDKYTIFITHINKDDFSKAFADNPIAVAYVLRTIFANWDKYITFIANFNKDVLSKVLIDNPQAVAYAFRIIFVNEDEDKLTALIKHVTQAAFTKAFADNPRAVAHALTIIFADWDKYTIFITHINKDDFSKAFADNPQAFADILLATFVDWDKYITFITHVTQSAFSKALADNPVAVTNSIAKIFNNWDEYNKLYSQYGRQLNILRDYASETDQQDITDIFIIIKMFDILKLLKDLPKEADRRLLRELLDKKGLEGLYLILKFFYEFNPLFADKHKPSFIRNFLGINFINQEFGFRYGRNYAYISAGENREPVYTITKVFGSIPSAKEEFNGLKLLEEFGKLTKITLNEKSTSITYSTTEPGLFIMPTEFMAYASKQERMKILISLLKESLLQIYSLAHKGYAHTSLTSLSHGIRDDNTPNEWIPYRGGEITDVQEGLKHLNFRPGIGLVDAEHIFYSRELEHLDSSILNKDVAGSVFELLLGLCYGAIVQGFSTDEIVSSFTSIELDIDALPGELQHKQQIFKGSEKHLRRIINDIITDHIPHQRDTNALLPWLEENLPGLLTVTASENRVILPELINVLDYALTKSSSAGKEKVKEEIIIEGLLEKERAQRISGLLGELASINSMQEVLPLKWMETISSFDIIEFFKNIRGIELEAENLLMAKLLWHIVCHTLGIEGRPLKPFYELVILDISEESIAGHSAEFSYYLRLMIEEKMEKEIKVEIEKMLKEKKVKKRESLIEEWDKAVDGLLEEYINNITLLLKDIEVEFKRQDLFKGIEGAMEHFRERFNYVSIKHSSAGRETRGKKNKPVADFTLRITKEMIQAVMDGSEFRSAKNGKDYEIKAAVEEDWLVIWVKEGGQPDELNRDEHSYIELDLKFTENKNKTEILIDRESIKEPDSGILTNILDYIIPYFNEITYVSTNQCPQIIAGAERTIENILRRSGRGFKTVQNNFGGVFYINKPKPFNPHLKKSEKEHLSAIKLSSAGEGGVAHDVHKDGSLSMDRRQFLKQLVGIPAFLTVLGTNKREASAQGNIFEDPRDLILDFGQAIDSTVLEKYISVIKEQGLLEFSSVIQNDSDTMIIVKLGENKVDAEVVAGRLNKALSGKISFAKKFKCVKSSIIWEETKTYKEIENFVNRVARISDSLGMGRVNRDNLRTLLEGVTYVESKYLHWERRFGKIKPIESYTGAIGATQLVKSKAVKHIAELVFKHKDGLIKYSSIISELKRVLEEKNPEENYLSAYFEAGDDTVLQRYAVEKLRRKILANPLLKGVNLYYALSLWLILVENKKISTTLKIDRKIIEQIANIAQSDSNVISGKGAYKPKNLHEAECRCGQDLLRAEVIFRMLGEEVIKDIAIKHKTNSKRFEVLFNYMKVKVFNDKSYNQKVGYVYLFYLWDRARRLQLKKREQGYAFTEELPEYFEFNSRSFDERLAAAAAYNSGWSTVSKALKGFGAEKDKDTIPRWIKNMIGPNRRNPREPINYLRTYLEYILHYKSVLVDKDYNLMCALIEERYNRLRYVATKKGPRLIEYSKIITSDGQKRYTESERSKDDLFNYKLASLLASLLGSDYVDSYIISWGMPGWEDNILSSTAPTFKWLAKRMYNEESVYREKGEQVLNYFRDNKKQYGKSLAALENSISALTKHKEPWIVLQKKIKAEAKRQKIRGYLVWGFKYATPVFLAGLIPAALGYIIYRRLKREKASKVGEAVKTPKPKKRQVIYKPPALYKSKTTGKVYLGKAFVSDKEQKYTVEKSEKKHPPIMKSSSSGENRNEIITEMPIIKQASISGQQLSAQALELEKLCVSMFNFPYDLQFGYSPYRYGIIIDEAVLRNEEKRIIEFLASQKTSTGKAKFIILINTKDAKESMIDKWGLLHENILSVDKFFKQRGVDQSWLGSEQAKVIQAARLLKNRISQGQPIGIIAGPSVDIEKMAHNMQRENVKGVFISSQQPAAAQIDISETSIIANFMFEALLADILLKLKSYNPAKKYTIQELIEILPPIISIEFMEKIELLKAATEAISQAA